MKKSYNIKRPGGVWKLLIYTSLFCLLMILNACTKNNIKVLDIKPDGPQPAWGPNIRPQMLAVIEKYESYNLVPAYMLTPEQARMQPPIADAAADVASDYHIYPPYMNIDTMGISIPVGKDFIHARIYTPPTGKSNYPVIVYYHGGGFVLATIDTYDASCRALSAESAAIVVSVEYRKAPEFTFPTAHNDANAAYEWVLAKAGTFNGDTSRVAVAGESAGGNLACNVSIAARQAGIKMPVHQLLVYPLANSDPNTPSYIQYANAMPLSKPLAEWFLKYYVPDASDDTDPRIALVHADLHNLPPTTLIAAQIDPLQSEGKMLADNLKTAGVPVTYQLFEGVTHEFFGMGAVLPQAKAAEVLAAGEFRKAFHN